MNKHVIWVSYPQKGKKLNDYRSRVLATFLRSHTSNCMLDGAKTVTLFSDMNSAARRIVPDGIKSDWENVGSDMRKAVTIEKARREREAG